MMKNNLFACVLWTACVFVFVCAQDQTSVAPNTTVNSPTTEPVTTQPPNATEPQTTNTTNPSTTEPQTTNSTSNTSTTNAQTTEPSVTTAEATTVGPTIPPPAVAEFKVNGSDGKVCLILKGALQFQVQYRKKDNKTGTATINIPADATSSGTCVNNTSSLTLKFGKTNATRTVTYNFETVDGTAKLSTWELSLDLDDTKFPDHENDTLKVTVTQNTALSKDSMYYMCDAEEKFTTKGADAVMSVSNFKVQAFNVENGKFAEYGVDCSADIPVVPKAKSKDTFTVKEGNTTCIVFQAEMAFEITYLSAGKNKTKTIFVPDTGNVTSDGSCSGTNGSSQYLTLTFYDGWMLKLTFVKSGSSVDIAASNDKFKYHLGNVELKYNLNSVLFPDATNPGQSFTISKNFSSSELSGNLDGSYMCTSGVTLDLSNSVKLTTTNLQYQAFHTKNNTDFGDATECKVDEETNSIVPIAVGAALAGLVVIVLIAYLIGRRRSRTGYEQV